MFGITNSYATLWMDCEPILNENGLLITPLKSIAHFGGKNGFITLAQMAKSLNTMPIDLQWAVINCDATKASNLQCDESEFVQEMLKR